MFLFLYAFVLHCAIRSFFSSSFPLETSMSTACRRFIDQKWLGYTPSYSCFYNTFFRQLSTISEYCGVLSIYNVSSLFLVALTVSDAIFSFLSFNCSIIYLLLTNCRRVSFYFSSISLYCVYKILFLSFRKCLSSFINSFFLSLFFQKRFFHIYLFISNFFPPPQQKKNIYLFFFYFCIWIRYR